MLDVYLPSITTYFILESYVSFLIPILVIFLITMFLVLLFRIGDIVLQVFVVRGKIQVPSYLFLGSFVSTCEELVLQTALSEYSLNFVGL